MNVPGAARLDRMNAISIIILGLGLLVTSVMRDADERRQASYIQALERRIAAIEARTAPAP